ncbi:MAG TPA: hypothetical protein VKE69_08620 [Planctomycetota bacterium]|nr:hypothetical protein [Planctomycetota bacterium]
MTSGDPHPAVRWSRDAWVLVRPAAAFRFIAANPAIGSPLRLLCGRPAFVAFVLGCVVSLAATGTLTARLVFPAPLYWAVVPLVEIAALAVALPRRSARISFPGAVDAFFTGHAAWTLCLVGLVTSLALVAPTLWWTLMTRVGVPGLLLVLLWSLYTDFCFFRFVIGSSPRAAAWAVALHRAVSWAVVALIFAIPALSPAGIAREIVEVVREVLP